MQLRTVVLLLCLVPAAVAQSVQITASNISNLFGTKLASGRVCLQATDSKGQPIAFKSGAGAQITYQPGQSVCAAIVNGAFSVTVPDTALTVPVNVCYALTVKDLSNGQTVLGQKTAGQPSGYDCLQPTTSNSWCSGGICNFDNYQPNLAPLVTVQQGPMGPPGPPFNARGPWSNSASYQPGDAVSYTDGNIYICYVANTNVVPTNTSYWMQDPANFASPPPLGNVTPNRVQATVYNGVLMADAYSGSDIAAKANTAAATLTNGGTVVIPPGTWNTNTTLACQNDKVVFRGGGSRATVLNYTGSGIAVDLNAGFPRNGCELHDLGVTTSNGSAVGIKAGGLYQTVENVFVNNGSSAKALWITGNPGTTQQSFSTHLINVDLENFPAIGIQVDHAVDIYMDQVRAIALQNSTTALPFVLETGVSGLFLNNTTTGYGLHNLWIKSSTGSATYGYDATPQFLFFTNFVGDGACGGDGWLFDSTLINNYLGAHFVNSWAASAGNCVSLTPGANAVHISGGSGLFIDTSHLIRSAGNGILFDSTTATNLTITNNEIESNNQDNAADQHGIYITTPTNLLGIIGNTVGNTVYGGYQRYGVKIGAVAVDNLRLVGNELTFNVTDGFLNLSTSVTYPGTVIGNTPISVGNKMNGQSLVVGQLDASNESGGNVAAFGQITTTNPKQLQILNDPASNTLTLQAVQQGVLYNQDLLIQPQNGSSARIGNPSTTTYILGALNLAGNLVPGVGTTPTVNTAVCWKDVTNKILGYCSTALSGSPPTCTCN